MKMFKLRNLALAVGAALSLGAASQAMAVPTFTIDTSAITGGAQNLVVGDKFSGNSSELLTTSGNTHTGSGWLQISALDLLGTPQIGFGNLGTFGLYVTFTLADTLASGAINTSGSTSNLTLLDFTVWADPNKNTTFTQANIVGPTDATVGGTTSDDIVLASGSLINGTAGIDALGGAFLNSIETFAVCTGNGTADLGGTAVADPSCTNGTGSAFFFDPVPFFNLAFTEFNNTSQGLAISGGNVAINQATGAVDFNRTVPEPATLALLGIGLMGLGVTARRRKAS